MKLIQKQNHLLLLASMVLSLRSICPWRTWSIFSSCEQRDDLTFYTFAQYWLLYIQTHSDAFNLLVQPYAIISKCSNSSIVFSFYARIAYFRYVFFLCRLQLLLVLQLWRLMRSIFGLCWLGCTLRHTCRFYFALCVLQLLLLHCWFYRSLESTYCFDSPKVHSNYTSNLLIYFGHVF